VPIGYAEPSPKTRGQCKEVDLLLNLSLEIADAVDLFTVMFAGKEVLFDGATLLYATSGSDIDGRLMLSLG
jgi:hypothetical protein